MACACFDRKIKSPYKRTLHKENNLTRIEFGLGYDWRRKRDSNPRGLAPKRFSRPPRYDRFDIPPSSNKLFSIHYHDIIY